MNNPFRFLLSTLSLCALAVAGLAQTPATKPGYNVTVEISYDETGKPEDAKIVRSDDPTGDHTLERLVMKLVEKDQQPPKVVDGKAVKFKARRPFNFPVAGDKGEAANADRPVLRAGNQVIPKFPESMVARNEAGGVILALVIRADGTVKSTEVLASSHPEYAQEARAALSQWVFNPRDGAGMPPESTWNIALGFANGEQQPELKWRLAPRPSIGSFIVGRLPPAPPAVPAAPVVPAPAETK